MNINDILYSYPLPAVAAAVGFAVGFVAALITAIIVKRRTRRFVKDLKSASESGIFPRNMYSDKFILRHSKYAESFARDIDTGIISLIGIDDLWLERYKTKPDRKTLERILEFIPEKGLFKCFLGVLKKPALSEPFFGFIGTEPGTLRKLPLSGSGEPFDSNKAKEFFTDRFDEIREMAGDPEWSVRYFSIKLILTERDERAVRAIEEAFSDSHPLIRKTVIEESEHFTPEELYPVLLEKMIDDPSGEVRRAAYNRIKKDFNDIHKINYQDLDDVQLLHALSFLDSEREDDIDTAFRFLKSENLEIRFPAALFLQKHGYLKKILDEVDFKDTEVMNRNIDLLVKASEVKVDAFLSGDISDPASVFAAMSILGKSGNREYIGMIAERVFASDIGNTDRKVWESVVRTIYLRGDEYAASVLMREFDRRKYQEQYAEYLLERIPDRMEHIVYGTLFNALTDAGFKSRESLEKAFVKLPPDKVISDLFVILEGGREYPHNVRVSALKILAGFKLPYCLQPLIEQLPTLPVDEARTFSNLLSVYNGELFNSRIMRVLKQEDAKVRAAVIASLPGTGVKEFLKPIKEALHDSDPDVRIASIWALADYGEGKVLGQAVEMLRDPVERVRTAAAVAVGKYTTAEKLDVFTDVIKNPDEVAEVKKAAIKGLAGSKHKKSIDILVQIIDEDETLRDYAIQALSTRTAKKDLTAIIENIKDASPALRQHIMLSLKKMGQSGEETIAALLEEDIVSLKEQINRILEESGYVEHKIRLLSHRDPQVRKNAALFLSRLGTQAAFRGIVLAARDPEEDVRVQVTRALEKLNSDEGKEILEKLQNDPDKRVRKFTRWALERMHSKAIED